MKKKNYFWNKTTVMVVLFLVFWTAPVYGATRDTDVTEPREGNSFIAVEGTFSSATKNNILNRINAIRQEACKEGVPNPIAPKKKLQASDYHPLKWSSDLEWIAQTRAAEAMINQQHTRPNGLSCFTVKHNKMGSSAEELAWNWDGMMYGIEQWYREKKDWVNKTGKTTGHYTALINPDTKYVGIGTFRISEDDWYTVAAELTDRNDLDETKIGVTGKYQQIIEVPTSTLTVSLPKNIILSNGSNKQLVLSAKTILKNTGGGENVTEGTIPGNITWESKDPEIASITSTGKVIAHKIGSAVITATTKEGLKAQSTIIVPYTIKYVLNGGKNHKSNPNTYTSQITLKNPTRKNYTFGGWYKENTFKTKITKLSGGNQTVYAKWMKVNVGKGKTPKLKNAKKKKLTVSYSSVSGVKGYQIQYSTNKNFKKSVKKCTLKGKKKTFTVTKGKKYYVKVRAYKIDSTGVKVYGNWSKVKSKLIKK